MKEINKAKRGRNDLATFLCATVAAVAVVAAGTWPVLTLSSFSGIADFADIADLAGLGITADKAALADCMRAGGRGGLWQLRRLAQLGL